VESVECVEFVEFGRVGLASHPISQTTAAKPVPPFLSFVGISEVAARRSVVVVCVVASFLAVAWRPSPSRPVGRLPLK